MLFTQVSGELAQYCKKTDWWTQDDEIFPGWPDEQKGKRACYFPFAWQLFSKCQRNSIPINKKTFRISLHVGGVAPSFSGDREAHSIIFCQVHRMFYNWREALQLACKQKTLVDGQMVNHNRRVKHGCLKEWKKFTLKCRAEKHRNQTVTSKVQLILMTSFPFSVFSGTQLCERQLKLTRY